MKLIALSWTVNNGKSTCLEKWSRCKTVKIFEEIARAVYTTWKYNNQRDVQIAISREEYKRKKQLMADKKKRRWPKLMLTDRTVIENVFFLDYAKKLWHIPENAKPYYVEDSVDMYDIVILFTEMVHPNERMWWSAEFQEYYLERMRATFPKEKLKEFRNYKEDQEEVDLLISLYT